jgi:3-methyladenine DNA glycosylase/8-oxoguanine DNA glycosylase
VKGHLRGDDAEAKQDVVRIGLPIARAEAIRALAQCLADGRISFGVHQNMDELPSQLSSKGQATCQKQP